MRTIPRLDRDSDFPPSCEALEEPNGLIAVGGGLSSQRLLAAYSRGIFPWYEEPQPILWWTPDPRSVLLPQDLHISRSLHKTLRSNAFHLSVDKHFTPVMRECAQLRGDGLGTWIDEPMTAAYSLLHQQGFAHSIEVLDDEGVLVGGLYGVALGKFFFGESMFHTQTNASKVVLAQLARYLERAGFVMLDCQVPNPHLFSMGACQISRADFLECLAVGGLGPGGIAVKVVFPEVL